nr:metal ABC transporter permease [Marinomonas algarum]
MTLTIKYKQREDMLIGAVWAIGMAIGLLAIAKTPGYSTHLMSYLLGNLLLVSRDQVVMMVGLNLLMLLLLVLLHRPLMATLADEKFARLRGVKTNLLYLGFLVIIALATVILVHSVGLILVMALLTLPAATGLLLTSTLGRLMLIATLLSGLSIFGGLAVAYETDSPTGAVIVLLAATIYLVILIVKSRYRKRI